MSVELVLLVISTPGAGVAAVFAILGFLRTEQSPSALTPQGATQILRAETDIVRTAAGSPTFSLGADEMEMGVGIHGEPGRSA